MFPAAAMEGDVLTTSQVMPGVDGTLPAGTAAYEKRATAVTVPEWQSANCIQCNQCSMVCPHAVIRPLALDAEEVAAAPAGMKMVDFKNKKLADYKFAIVISPHGLHRLRLLRQRLPRPQQGSGHEAHAGADASAGDLQRHRLLRHREGHGPADRGFRPVQAAPAGVLRRLRRCGETPYAKLVTQLFGDRMYVANATGCSSIWGGSAPSTPLHRQQGRPWPCLGELPVRGRRRVRLRHEPGRDPASRQADRSGGDSGRPGLRRRDCGRRLQGWLAAKDDPAESRKTGDALVSVIENFFANQDQTGTPFEEKWLANGKKCDCPACTAAREILEKKDLLTKKSMWIFGGDGFAYDIGYGGLDHVLASHENVNVLIFDTEVYSNTGGQSSKSTPTGAVAQFAALPVRRSRRRTGFHLHAVRLRLCGSGRHGRQHEPDPPGHPGGRGL